jgi:F-type H+-transporting ATPase subunit b
VTACRGYSADKPVPAAKAKVTAEPTVEETIAAWDAANKVYYGPQRDLVNFPPLVSREFSPPTRLGFVPETWFKFMYEKTGVTGPYVLGFGSLTFLLSKEIWVIEHGFSHFIAFWFLFYYLAKKYGRTIGTYFDNYSQSLDNRHWYKPMEKTIADAESTIKQAEVMIWREAGQKYLFEAKRENVDLQLESVYRQRLNEVYQAVKKRLDYQMEIDSARRHIQQQHMVQWIVDQVVKGITPQQEKDSLSKCISDLKSLATAKPATA